MKFHALCIDSPGTFHSQKLQINKTKFKKIYIFIRHLSSITAKFFKFKKKLTINNQIYLNIFTFRYQYFFSGPRIGKWSFGSPTKMWEMFQIVGELLDSRYCIKRERTVCDQTLEREPRWGVPQRRAAFPPAFYMILFLCVMSWYVEEWRGLLPNPREQGCCRNLLMEHPGNWFLHNTPPDTGEAPTADMVK